MMYKTLSDHLKDWDEQFFLTPTKGMKSRNIRCGDNQQIIKPVAQNVFAIQQKMQRTIKKVPEVMVKISGGGKNMVRIRAHMDYISRNGQLDLEDENGELYQKRAGLNDLSDMWTHGRMGISEVSEKRKEAFNIILSMPPKTDRHAVKKAARLFVQSQFKGYQYVFVAHDDEKHPHVHLCVKAVNCDGIRLNPRKADLQLWRSLFAEKLRDQGIAANATPRRVRGIIKKADKQAILHIDQGFQQGKRSDSSYIKQAQRQAAVEELKGDKYLINPVQSHIDHQRKALQKAYGQIAKALVKGNKEEQKLALDIVHFVRAMPPLTTKHDKLVKTLKNDSIKEIFMTYNSKY